MQTEGVSRYGRAAATVVLGALLVGLRLPPDEPRPTPAPAPRATAPRSAPAATAVPSRPAPPLAIAPPPAPPPAPAPPPSAPPPPARAAPAPLEDTGVALPPRTGGTPAPVPPRAPRIAAEERPATATDVPPVVPWALLPGLSMLLAVLLLAAVWLLRWPGRLLGTARLALATPPPAAVPAADPTAVVTLGAAAQRLPPAVQRDLAELAVLLDEEGFGPL